MRRYLLSGLAAITLLSAAAANNASRGNAPLQNAPFNKTRATFKSHDLTLVGFSYHPDGAGPFPTVALFHGGGLMPSR